VGSPGRRCRKPGRTRAWMVCALLAGSLWRGPVPWIHSHERLEAQGLPESALAWHVRHLHPDQGEHAIFGWHVHFSYPWDVSNEPSPPPNPKAPRPRAVYDMPYVVLSASSTLDASRLAGLFHGDLVSSLATVWLPLPLLTATALDPEFPRAPLSGVSLRALICVARC
jgi:hypothetical protein